MNEKIKYKSLIIFGFLSLLYSEEPLTVGFWNVENLFDLENNPNKNDDEFSIGGRKNVDQEIYDLKLKHCSEVLSDLNVGGSNLEVQIFRNLIVAIDLVVSVVEKI
jgi:hypothetical protein